MSVRLTEARLRQIIREEVIKQGAKYKHIAPKQLLKAAEEAGDQEDVTNIKNQMKSMKSEQEFHVDPDKCKVYIQAAPGQDIWNYRFDISPETCEKARGWLADALPTR